MTTWFYSDPHFGHAATFEKFKQADGVTPLRPFTSVDEMHDTMIKRWNERVQDSDKVYVLGDIAMKEQHMHAVMPNLRGRKTMIRGNHDIFHIKAYLKYFDEVHAVRKLSNFVMTHIPIHPDSMGRYGVNVHGHLHARDVPDGRYLCVCVEHTNFAPISEEEVLQRIAEKQKRYPMSNLKDDRMFRSPP